MKRIELEKQVGALASGIREGLERLNGKDKVGFALFLFDFGQEGAIAYASNARREDFIKTLEEFLAKYKAAKAGT